MIGVKLDGEFTLKTVAKAIETPDAEIFLKARCSRSNLALTIDCKAIAVKDKLVLPTHQVAKNRWNFMAYNMGENHLEPLVLLV